MNLNHVPDWFIGLIFKAYDWIEWMNQRRTTRSSFVSFYALSHSQSIYYNDWLRFVCHGDCWLTTVKHESAFSVMHALLCTHAVTRDGLWCVSVSRLSWGVHLSSSSNNYNIIWIVKPVSWLSALCLSAHFVPWHPSITFVIDVLITVSFSLTIKSILYAP